LKPDEKEIAKRFVNKIHPSGELYYDVHLDSAALEFPDHWTKRDVEHWKQLKAKRIDLLIDRPDVAIIFEITPKVSKAAVGGVLSYRELYKTQYSPGKPVNVGLIVGVDDPTYHSILKMYDIELYVV
jgi:hypothetical protein